jgi:hypothetical protein
MLLQLLEKDSSEVVICWKNGPSSICAQIELVDHSTVAFSTASLFRVSGYDVWRLQVLKR